MHVAVLGLGPSVNQYLHLTKSWGGRKAFCDEVWGINALGGVFECDRIFHMDDVRIQEIRAKARPKSNIARMLEWLKTTKVPVVTSIPHPDYPSTVAFPLAEVLQKYEYAYFNSTAAYAIAYAMHIGVKQITCFGMDYTYADAHQAEKGRACVEFWLGQAVAQGIHIAVPKTTSLMDACEAQGKRFYGYDCVQLELDRDLKTNEVSINMVPRDKLPTADEIEAEYDHSAHPNPLVEG